MSTEHQFDAPAATAPSGNGELQAHPTYPWLLSGYDDPSWIVTDPGPGQRREIHFDALFHDGSRLTDPQHAHLLSTIRTIVAQIRTGPFAITDDAEKQRKVANHLFTLTKWMLLNRIHRFDRLCLRDFLDWREAALYGAVTVLDAAARVRAVAQRYREEGRLPPRTDSAVRLLELDRAAIAREAGVEGNRSPEVAYEIDRISLEWGFYLTPSRARRAAQAAPETRKVSASSLRFSMDSWRLLWEMRRVLPDDHLTFNPFESQSVTNMAGALAEDTGRTPTIPVRLAMFLIDRSIRWVMDYAEDLLRLREQILSADVDHGPPGALEQQTADKLRAYLEANESAGTIPTSRGKLATARIAAEIGVHQATLFKNPITHEMLAALQQRLGITLAGDTRNGAAGTLDPDEGITIRQASRESAHTYGSLLRRYRSGMLHTTGRSKDGYVLVRRGDVLALPAPKRRKGIQRSQSCQRLWREYREILGAFRPTSGGPGQPWPLHPRFRSSGGGSVDVNTAINVFLPAACMIVICAFSARRHEEVTQLRANEDPAHDVITGEAGERWLTVWIEKTLREWDRVPVPEVVVRAVEVLKRWSEGARRTTGKPNLFQWENWRGEEAHGFYAGPALAAFGNFLQMPEDPEHGRWALAPHQLRRFFAIMYMWRYEYGELSALSWMLRHFNLEMTRRYATEAERGAIFREVQEHHSYEVLRSIASGDRQAGGGFVNRFTAMMERQTAAMRRNVEVVTPQRRDRKVKEYVRRTGIVLKPMPWGYCACGETAEQTAKSNCRQGQDPSEVRGPDPGRARPAVCANCPHNCTGPEFSAYWTGEIQQLEQAAADPHNPPILRESSQEQLAVVRRYAEEAVFRGRSDDGTAR